MVSHTSGRRARQQPQSSRKNRHPASKGKKGKKTSKGRKKSAKRRNQPEDDDADIEAQTLTPKQIRVIERAAAAKRKEIISSVSSVFFGCAFVGLLTALLVDPKLGVAAGGGLMCLILSFKFQRLALYAFIIYMPFAGTVTYALGGNSLLQIAKDVFYVPALIGVYQFCKKNRLPIILPKALKPPLLALIAMVCLTALVTNLPDQLGINNLPDETGPIDGKLPLVMAIWGAKVLLGYVPLVACIYYLIRTRDDLEKLLRLQAVLILVACCLGLMQYGMLKTGICPGTIGEGEDLFRASLQARCFVGGSLLYAPSMGQIRLPGTFVAPWQWGWFLISGTFFSFGTAFSDKSFIWRIVGLVSLVVVIMMAFLSGQRIALVLVPFSIALLVVMTGQLANFKRFVPIMVPLGLIVFYLIANNPEVVNERVDSLISRWSASPPQQFIVEQFSQVTKEQEGIFGAGVGRATNSARTFGKTKLIETYHPKLVYELGPLGLLAALAVYTTMTVVTFRVYRQTKDKNLRSYAASMWVFILFISYSPYYYPLDVDPVAVYYWLAAGIVIKIPALEKQEKERRAALLRPPEEAGTSKKRKKKEEATFV
ncbi:MAG: hormogonium polysaccharide biosynthesis protein HpsL [Cyanobacteria bacterium P01_D01_bin.1]